MTFLPGQHRNWSMSSLRLMIAVLSVCMLCQGFAPIVSTHHRTTTCSNGWLRDQSLLLQSPLRDYRKMHSLQHGIRHMDTHLFQSKDGAQVDGTGRGLALFSLVFALCVWSFSIPPEFRRAHLCMAEKCVQNRAMCYDCVTFDEWKDGVAQYYRNGGGVQFDFTVAEETKAVWSGGISK